MISVTQSPCPGHILVQTMYSEVFVMDYNPKDFPMEEAMRMAQSDAGQQLLAFLQQTQGQQLQNAMDQAAAGDYEQVRRTMQTMLASPEAQAILKKLGG